jgi:hypothetical protein
MFPISVLYLGAIYGQLNPEIKSRKHGERERESMARGREKAWREGESGNEKSAVTSRSHELVSPKHPACLLSINE